MNWFLGMWTEWLGLRGLEGATKKLETSYVLRGNPGVSLASVIDNRESWSVLDSAESSVSEKNRSGWVARGKTKGF